MSTFGIGNVTGGVGGTTISDPSSGSTGSASPLGSQVTDQSLLNYGIPATSQGAQFELEEQAAAAARGQSYAALWAGFKLPAKDAGDFWQLYSLAETFASNTGWKYLPSPKQLLAAINAGMATANQLSVFQYFAKQSGVNEQKMPWAGLGMSATQYAQSTANMGDTLYSLTGKSTFEDAGLGAIADTAMFQNWTSQQIQDYIQKNPTLNKQYGYLQYGQNYTQFQNYKVQNAQSLQQRYGHQYTDQQAISNLGDPLNSFHASGGTFGESVPYVAASSQLPTGRQSSVR